MSCVWFHLCVWADLTWRERAFTDIYRLCVERVRALCFMSMIIYPQLMNVRVSREDQD